MLRFRIQVVIMVWCLWGSADPVDPNALCSQAWAALENQGFTEPYPNSSVRPGILFGTLARMVMQDGKPSMDLGYGSYTTPITTGEVHQISGSPDPRVATSTLFTIPKPDPDHALWPKLSGKERIQLAMQVEHAFANAVFGIDILHRYLKEGMYGENYAKFYRRMKPPEIDVDPSSPRFQLPEEALAEKPENAFSPYLFLHAALIGEPVGLCQQIACAKSGILQGFGMPASDSLIAWGKPRKVVPLYHHYFSLNPKDPGIWIPVDGTPMFPPATKLRESRKNPADDGARWEEAFSLGHAQDPNFAQPRPLGSAIRLPSGGRFPENGD